MTNTARIVKYTATNECLPAIVEGLDVKPEDSILAVCGSGDQAFALLEYAGSVLAVDIQRSQVDYARERMRHLINARYDDFLGVNSTRPDKDFYINPGPLMNACLERRGNYFRDGRRLARIRKRAGRMRFRVGAIQSSFRKGEVFQKIYLSNAFNAYCGKDMEKLSSHLSDGGLIYAANGQIFSDAYGNDDWPKGIIFDSTLSAQAGRWNSWNPGVFRKIVMH